MNTAEILKLVILRKDHAERELKRLKCKREDCAGEIEHILNAIRSVPLSGIEGADTHFINTENWMVRAHERIATIQKTIQAIDVLLYDARQDLSLFFGQVQAIEAMQAKQAIKTANTTIENESEIQMALRTLDFEANFHSTRYGTDYPLNSTPHYSGYER